MHIAIGLKIYSEEIIQRTTESRWSDSKFVAGIHKINTGGNSNILHWEMIKNVYNMCTMPSQLFYQKILNYTVSHSTGIVGYYKQNDEQNSITIFVSEEKVYAMS